MSPGGWAVVALAVALWRRYRDPLAFAVALAVVLALGAALGAAGGSGVMPETAPAELPAPPTGTSPGP